MSALREAIALTIAQNRLRDAEDVADLVLGVVHEHADYEAATEAMLKSIESRGVPDKYAARAAVDAALVEGGNQ